MYNQRFGKAIYRALEKGTLETMCPQITGDGEPDDPAGEAVIVIMV